ncbi:MAG: site-2 protease family protein [Terriglobia bacterium]|jgi:membrane-associated protease RseP (regulator of RpoE activity)
MGDESQFGRIGQPPVSEIPWSTPAWVSVRWGFGARKRWYNSLPFHLGLFLLTVLTTLVVGAHIELNYAHNLPVLDWDVSLAFFRELWRQPELLVLGVPFSSTLLGILLAHELGHYLTCRHYGIHATYPYFIPAPTLIGTLGAFIRIKSPIVNRRELFDVGISGPIAGFVLAIPALILAIFLTKGTVPAATPDSISLGNPLAVILLTKLFRSGINPAEIILHPVGCAAWVGLFATALNLLPVGQLDGGHILYAVLGDKCRNISRGFFLVLLPLGYFCWYGWIAWAVILFFIGLRHPKVLEPVEPLGRKRKILAIVAAIILVLTFLPTPFKIQ